MSLEMEEKEKMIQTCQDILELCDKPFVWEDEEIYPYHNIKKPFNLYFPHPQIEKELNNLLQTLSGFDNLYDQVKATCTLVEEWFEYGTYGLDRDFTRYFHKYALKPDYVEQVKNYFNNRLRELEKS